MASPPLKVRVDESESSSKTPRRREPSNKENSASGKVSFYAMKGGFAFLDQGLFAASNFIVNVLMARLLPPSQFGAFAVAFSIFLLLGAFYTSVLTEPMMVFGASKYKGTFGRYLGVLSLLHIGLSTIVTLLLAISALLFWHLGSPFLADALFGLAVASPMLMFTWLMRAACYVRSRPQWAAIGSGIYLALFLSGFYVLFRMADLTPGMIFGSMGAAGLLTSVWFLWILAPVATIERKAVVKVVGDHWTFGSWNVMATALNLASGQILIILIPPFFGLAAAARVAASLNFMRPLNPLMRSVVSVALPYASRLRSSTENEVDRTRKFQRLLLGFPVFILLYGLTVSLASRDLFFHVYGSHRYDDCGVLLFLLSLTYTASMLVQVFSVSIKAAGATRLMVSVWALPGILTCLLSLPALLLGNLSTVLGVFAFSYWVGALWSWRIATRLTSGSATIGSALPAQLQEQ